MKALGCKFEYSDTPNQFTNNKNKVATSAGLATYEHPAYKCKTLDELKQAVIDFKGCALKATALNTVFADGNIKADVMLIGEAPGAEEDAQGLPFVGQSGQLLNKILLSIGLTRENVYIANIVPWRPPGNRTPTTEEIALCQPFIEKHIELINPKFLVLVGGISAKTILKTNEGVSKLRGKLTTYESLSGRNINCIATFHPAYLMRSPGQKAQVWLDFLLLKKSLIEHSI